MNNEFKKIKSVNETRYVLESSAGGGTGSGAVANVTKTTGVVQRRVPGQVVTQEEEKEKLSQKPRQGPLRPQTGGGRHTDKTKTIPRKQKYPEKFEETKRMSSGEKLTRAVNRQREKNAPDEKFDRLQAQLKGMQARMTPKEKSVPEANFLGQPGGIPAEYNKAQGNVSDDRTKIKCPYCRTASPKLSFGRDGECPVCDNPLPAGIGQKALAPKPVPSPGMAEGYVPRNGPIENTPQVVWWRKTQGGNNIYWKVFPSLSTASRARENLANSLYKKYGKNFTIGNVAFDSTDPAQTRAIDADKYINKKQSKDAFDNMFGGGNPAGNLKIREQDVEEGRWEYDKSTAGMRHNTEDSDQRHGLYIDSKLIKTYSTRDEAENVKRRDPKFKNATIKKIAESDYLDGSSLPGVSTQQWQQAYQKAVMAIKNAKTQQDYEAASERAHKIKELLASKGIKVGPVLGQEGVAEGNLKEFDPGPDGIGPFKVYNDNEFIEKFPTFEEAKDEIDFRRDADPKSYYSKWRIVDGTGQTVWHYDIDDDIDKQRMQGKIQRGPSGSGVAETSKEKAEKYILDVTKQQTKKLGGVVQPDMYGKIEQTFGAKGKQRRAGVDRAMNIVHGKDNLDEVTGDLKFDTMLSKLVSSGKLQTIAKQFADVIRQFPQYQEKGEHAESMVNDFPEMFPNGYPSGRFYGSDGGAYQRIMQDWKRIGPDAFAGTGDEYNEDGWHSVLDDSENYTDYWTRLTPAYRVLNTVPGAETQVLKMVWHELFGGGVEHGTDDINKQGVAEDGEGTPEGLPHLTPKLLKHIVQQIGTDGVKALVKSLKWGDGAAVELLDLITQDLKDKIGMAEAMDMPPSYDQLSKAVGDKPAIIQQADDTSNFFKSDIMKKMVALDQQEKELMANNPKFAQERSQLNLSRARGIGPASQKYSWDNYYAPIEKLIQKYNSQPEEGYKMEEAKKKGLYYYVNKRKKAGTSRPASSPKAPTAQAWKDAAKTAQKEDWGMGGYDTYMKGKGIPEDIESDTYMSELYSKLSEKIPKNAPVDVWIKDFEKSNAPQFKGKNKEKRRQMAVAASYGAKNPSKRKK